MKKLLKKSILTFAAVLAVSATMAISAFADVAATSAYDKDTNTATVTITGATEGQQLTILVLKPGSDDTAVVEASIAYINQDPANPDGGMTYTIKLPDDLPDGTYNVKVGGTGVENIAVAPFTKGENGGDYTIGNVSGDTVINATDATQILQVAVGMRTEFNKGAIPLEVGDVDNSGTINGTDATQVLQVSVGSRQADQFKRKDVTTNKVTLN